MSLSNPTFFERKKVMILYNNLFENQEKKSMALFKKYFYINI